MGVISLSNSITGLVSSRWEGCLHNHVGLPISVDAILVLGSGLCSYFLFFFRPPLPTTPGVETGEHTVGSLPLSTVRCLTDYVRREFVADKIRPPEAWQGFPGSEGPSHRTPFLFLVSAAGGRQMRWDETAVL